MAKINQYPAKTVPSNNDEFVLHDPASGSTKKMTRGDLISGAPLPANSVDTQAIADGSVTSEKIDFSTGIWWEELGRVERTSAVASVSVPITQKKFMQIVAAIYLDTGEEVNCFVRVNGDSGNNYVSRATGISNSGTTMNYFATGTQNNFAVATNISTSNRSAQFDLTLSRPIGTSSVLVGSGVASSGAYGSRHYHYTGWNNTTNPITSIDFVLSSGTMRGTFVVLGHD